MPLSSRTVSEIMNPLSHSIGDEQPMAAAAVRMHEHGIRHLPVLRGGRLVGIVSDRDLAMVESLEGVDPQTVPVGEAMTTGPYVVGPDDRLGPVLRTMAQHKYGTAIVAHGGRPVGILTTIDALQLCADLLGLGD